MTGHSPAELAETLHDLDTHARGWTRLLLEEAARPEKTDEEMADLAGSATALAREASLFRVLRDSPERPDAHGEILACVDRALEQSFRIEAALDAAGKREGDRSWHDHEIAALHRLETLRAGLEPQLDPASGATPTEELRLLEAHLKQIGREALVEFSSEGRGATMMASLSGRGPEIQPDLAERLLRLAPFLLEGDMPGWQEGQGAEGRLRLCGDGEPWLDAVDHNEDWLLERVVGLDLLEDARWEEEEATLEP